MTSKANLQTQRRHPGVDRRQFIGAMGALAASSFLGIGDALAGGVRPDVPRAPSLLRRGERRAQPRADCERGGVLDAGDRLPASGGAADQAQAARNLIVDPAVNVNNPNHPTHTAGTTFMGQFMDHDMTFDQTSALGVETDPADSPNTRSPALDLDSVYLGGPRHAPHLYGFEGSTVKF